MDFLQLLAEFRTPFGNHLFQLITYLGEEVIVIAFICTLYWCVNKRFAYQLGFAYFIAGLFVQVLKITFRIPRPWILDPDFQAVESAVPKATGYSFPSGHTQSGTCLFGSLMLNTKKSLGKLLCMIIFVAIGFSRMYLGVHTPKDVFVSMGISLLTCIFLWRYQEKLFSNESKKKTLLCFLISFSVAAGLYAIGLLSFGKIDIQYASDCCKAAGAGLGFAIGWYIESTYIRFSTKEGTILSRVIKVIVGLLVAFILKEGIGLLFHDSLLAETFCYFIVVFWIIVIYPFLFEKLNKKY